MNREYTGESKNVLKYLGFLVDDYQMQFLFQSFDEYKGFCGPINTYSFYNNNGCFTLHQVVQRGEWGWYVSKELHKDQYALLETEISQNEYIRRGSVFARSSLKNLADIIDEQILVSKEFFGIKVE